MAKIEEHLLSIEQMNHLKELGLKFKVTALCWCRFKSDDYSYPWNFCKGEDRDRVSVMEYVPTLTLQEILEMLPSKIEVGPKGCGYEFGLVISKAGKYISYQSLMGREEWIEFFHRNMLEAAYNMLCWVAENRYLNKE